MKSGKVSAFVLILIAAMCAGCLSSGTLHVVISPDARYKAESQVLIVHKRSDPIYIQDDLEHRFLKAGFVVKPNLSADVGKNCSMNRNGTVISSPRTCWSMIIMRVRQHF